MGSVGRGFVDDICGLLVGSRPLFLMVSVTKLLYAAALEVTVPEGDDAEEEEDGVSAGSSCFHRWL